MRFLVPRRERVSDDALQRAYMAGMEQTPWQVHCRWVEDELSIEREIDESGNLYIPWQVDGQGELVLSTASLMERDSPYNLPVELARGTINRIRNQLGVWEPQGFIPSDPMRAELAKATERFIRAATAQNNAAAAAEDAEVALVHALVAISQLSSDFTEQVLALRHQQTPKLPTLTIGRLPQSVLPPPQAKEFMEAFNCAALTMNWREVELNEGEYNWEALDQQVEWCRSSGMKICGGPLLRLYQNNLPDWLYLWEDDFDSLRSYCMQYLEAVVTRFRGMVHIWHVTAGMNMTGTLELPEEYKLRLTVDAIQTVTQLDSRAPVIVSFDQPWGEYLAREDMDLSPLHFADALVRADLGLAGVGLEINLGYWPSGTLPRESLEINRQLDHWSHLGLPLLVMLTIPSSAEPDPNARGTVQPLANGFPDKLSPAIQNQIVKQLAPLLVSKQCVHGIIWNHVFDSEPHEFPHSGLFDRDQNPKPALRALAELRRKHLT